MFVSVGLVIGWSRGLTLSDFWLSMVEPSLWRQIGVGFVMYFAIVFVRQLDRLLGPGVLLRYVLGRYHHPRREARIFMFLDINESTMLAERLGDVRFYELINEFFRDISGPVLDRAGEIHEYVGDEAVITWKEATGIKDANCIRVFFEIERAIGRRRQRYLDRFGVVPGFKAGVHVGDVVSAEVGELKKGLVFNGDVLNTGARIQAQCRPLNRRLLSSAVLADRLDLPPDIGVEPMGPVELRGKTEPVELVAFDSA